MATSHTRLLTKVLILALIFIVVTVLFVQTGSARSALSYVHRPDPAPQTSKPESKPAKPPEHPIYKPTPTPAPPITENFPLAATAHSPTVLPPIPSWNVPPSSHVKESTPLLIGFTRNWLLLQQTVVSYITAGWPPDDIYVVENTGTMNANRLGNLTLQNPFYLDYRRLTDTFGVNVITTPTLLTFAQLQNFYTHTAMEKGWEYYFWGHMDVVALSVEDWKDPEDGEFKSLYMRCVDDLRKTLASGLSVDEDGETERWSIRFYAYDRLALVNRYAFEKVGGWDTMIPYYGTDCDMHERLTMVGLKQTVGHVGLVYDVGSSLEDLQILYRRKPAETKSEEAGNTDVHSARMQEEDERASPNYTWLTDHLNSMQVQKNEGNRNTWQATQQGGQGEPYYRDSTGFEKAIEMWIDHGQEVMHEKWGHIGCDLRKSGLKRGDAWKVEHDW